MHSAVNKEADMPVREGERKQLIAVIDDGTKTVRFVVYESEKCKEVASHQLDKSEIQPQEGWWEQDPKEILHHIHTCASVVLDKLRELGYTKEDIAALGVTNQRETTIAWDKYTGEPLHPAISWNDHRTNVTVDAILAKIPDRNKNHLKPICGLPISPYFSALKMRWMLDNVESVRETEGLCFGTVDTWIVWNLTGGPNGGLYITDVTNASRTLLMNLDTLNWDSMLLRIFGIDRKTLPDIRSSSEVYGVIKNGSVLDGITISGILGNQQSALVGQNCLKAGEAKSSFRSGCFLLYNTGRRRVDSTHGLVTTVAYQMGPGAEPCYALEGSIEVAGSALKFLRDNLKLIQDVQTDSEALGSQVLSTGDVYFVPAFNGLFAPYWRKDARGIICGLTQFTTRQHIIRAAMEAVCFQTRDILEAMNKDCGLPLRSLNVDGKMTYNDLLMQLQADIIGIPVCRAESWDMSAVGAAVVAARGIPLVGVSQQPNRHTFYPTTRFQDRNSRYTKWKMAVQRSLGWATTKKSYTMTGQHRKTSFPSLFKSNSIENPSHSRKLSHDRISLDSTEHSDNQNAVDELSKYAARKFSVSICESNDDRTILDDYDYFMSKNESDYGKPTKEVAPRVLNDWESIEEIIVNDPEIIFDCDDNPIIVDPRSFDLSDSESIVKGSDVGFAKRVGESNKDGVIEEVSNNGVGSSNS